MRECHEHFKDISLKTPQRLTPCGVYFSLVRYSLRRPFKKTPPKTALQTLACMRGCCVCWRYQKNLSFFESHAPLPQPAKRRIAMYARVSPHDQDPQMQLRELRAYAKSRAFTVAHAFIDHLSGTTSVRPELSKLWQTARARNIDTVLVWNFDRFARSTKPLLDALEACRHVVGCPSPADTPTAATTDGGPRLAKCVCTVYPPQSGPPRRHRGA